MHGAAVAAACSAWRSAHRDTVYMICMDYKFQGEKGGVEGWRGGGVVGGLSSAPLGLHFLTEAASAGGKDRLSVSRSADAIPSCWAHIHDALRTWTGDKHAEATLRLTAATQKQA